MPFQRRDCSTPSQFLQNVKEDSQREPVNLQFHLLAAVVVMNLLVNNLQLVLVVDLQRETLLKRKLLQHKRRKRLPRVISLETISLPLRILLEFKTSIILESQVASMILLLKY